MLLSSQPEKIDFYYRQQTGAFYRRRPDGLLDYCQCWSGARTCTWYVSGNARVERSFGKDYADELAYLGACSRDVSWSELILLAESVARISLIDKERWQWAVVCGCSPVDLPVDEGCFD